MLSSTMHTILDCLADSGYSGRMFHLAHDKVNNNAIEPTIENSMRRHRRESRHGDSCIFIAV